MLRRLEGAEPTQCLPRPVLHRGHSTRSFPPCLLLEFLPHPTLTPSPEWSSWYPGAGACEAMGVEDRPLTRLSNREQGSPAPGL